VLTAAGLATLFGGRFAIPAIAQAAKAAMVRDVDNPALQPVQFYLTMNQSGGMPQYIVYLPPVPAGKRLVVETVSLVDNNPGTTGGVLTVIPTVGGVTSGYAVPLQYNSTLQVTTGTLATHLYADAAGGIYLQYRVQNASDPNKYVAVSGYYVTL
jgi:predicted CDP-diglyceride synthetase/phosphatidate cytidylyltransferase